MQHEHLIYSKDFWWAIERILEHYFDAERTHYHSCSKQSQKSHIYHSLLRVRDALDRPRPNLDIEKHLATFHEVAVRWQTEDVLSVRPALTEEQAWEVLRECKRCHDANVGLNWDVLEITADILYPPTCEDPLEDAP